MGSSILRGLGAGLQTFGQEYGRALDKERAAKEREDRFTEQKRMNDSTLAYRDMQMKQMEFTNEMKKAAYAQNKIAQVVSASGYAPDGAGVEAYNKWHPSKVAWKYDAAKSSPNDVHMQRGYYKRDKETGEPEIGDDGKNIFVPFAGKSGVWNGTDVQWIEQFNKGMDPTYGQAMQQKKNGLEMEIKHADALHKAKLANDKDYKMWYESTPQGKREADFKESQTAKIKKETELMGTKGVKPPAATFKGIDGKKHAATSQEVEIAKADQRMLQDQGLEGIKVGDAYRIGQLQDDSMSMRTLDTQLKKVLDETMSPTEFLKFSKELNVPRAFLQKLLDDAMENPEMFTTGESGVQAQKSSGGISGWFKNIFSGSTSDDSSTGGVMF